LRLGVRGITDAICPAPLDAIGAPGKISECDKCDARNYNVNVFHIKILLCLNGAYFILYLNPQGIVGLGLRKSRKEAALCKKASKSDTCGIFRRTCPT